MKHYILDFSLTELEKYIIQMGEKNFRARQIFDWIYNKRINNFFSMTNIPYELRQRLDESFDINRLQERERKISSIDGTIRFDFITFDNKIISSVYLPQKDRISVCVSTQIGCPVGCYFCASGKKGFIRNLSQGEIIEQILQIERLIQKKIDGVLFMGMGEPLLNYKNLIGSIKMMTNQNFLSLGKRRIAISTVGIVDKISKLIDDDIRVRLSISLHAPDDETRLKLIPKRFAFPIEDILLKSFEYSRFAGLRLTIEYILISGINDTLQSVNKLVKLIRSLDIDKKHIQINLIPFNNIDNSIFSRPDNNTILNFKNLLIKNGFLTIIRESKGIDIGSACGQLGIIQI